MGLLALDSLSIPTLVWQEMQLEIALWQRKMAGDQKNKSVFDFYKHELFLLGLMWDGRNKPGKRRHTFSLFSYRKTGGGGRIVSFFVSVKDLI